MNHKPKTTNLVYPERSRREPQKLNLHFCKEPPARTILPVGRTILPVGSLPQSQNDLYTLKADPSCLKAQNKPNFGKDGNASSSLLLTTNDQRLTTREAQNKPKQTQFKPNWLEAQNERN
jgi:hypothetical protein